MARKWGPLARRGRRTWGRKPPGYPWPWGYTRAPARLAALTSAGARRRPTWADSRETSERPRSRSLLRTLWEGGCDNEWKTGSDHGQLAWHRPWHCAETCRPGREDGHPLLPERARGQGDAGRGAQARVRRHRRPGGREAAGGHRAHVPQRP